MSFDLGYMLTVLPKLLNYVYLTLGLTILSYALGCLFGLAAAIATTYRTKVLDRLARLYISFFRGTPLLVQLFIIYFGLPQLFPAFGSLTAYWAAVIGISLNSGAYLSETFRAAILSVDRGQWDALHSIGMNGWQGWRRIVLPQAARIAVPSMGNVWISVLKETSLAFTLGLGEVLGQAKILAGSSFRFFECYLAVALIYWAITILFGTLQHRVEKAMNVPYR